MAGPVVAEAPQQGRAAVAAAIINCYQLKARGPFPGEGSQQGRAGSADAAIITVPEIWMPC